MLILATVPRTSKGAVRPVRVPHPYRRTATPSPTGTVSGVSTTEFNPRGWTPAQVAGLLASGASAAAVRKLIALYPDVAAHTSADLSRQPDKTLPRPAGAVEVPDGGWMALRGTPAYPAMLEQLNTPPLMLFGMGNRDALRPGLAVVGSRAMSAYGRAVAQTAAAAAAALDVPVISGAAAGVDETAHHAAVDAGVTTVAVVATGPDVGYRSEHSKLYKKILAGGGAVVSEQPFATPAESMTAAPLAVRLATRNRITVALSRATVLCEATPGSGTLHAAWATLALGRPLLVALPRPGAEVDGARVPLALASDVARAEEHLKAMGMPAELARTWAYRAPLASGAARDRDELTLLVTAALLASPWQE